MSALYSDVKIGPEKGDTLIKTQQKALDLQLSTTATISTVASSATAVQLKAAESAPNQLKGLTITNAADKIMAIGTASDVTLTANLIVHLAPKSSTVPGGTWEVPFGFSGALYGIWDSGPTGSAFVTKFT